MSASKSTGGKIPHEYINDFLYFVVKSDGADRFILCSGVNLYRFLPLTRGRHGLGSNPALRGLQLVNLGVRDLALSRGATTRNFGGADCSGIAPTAESWYTQRLLVENAPEGFADDVISYGVVGILKKITNACMLTEAHPPDTLLAPKELQAFIEELCRKYDKRNTTDSTDT